jgi:DHA2 family multidrug resistance protein-like MFS transporter
VAPSASVIGSFVNSSYRNDLTDSLPPAIDPAAAGSATESIGQASEAAATLPPDTAAGLVQAANSAYVDAITSGFRLSAIVMGAAVVVGLIMIPRRMRAVQAGTDAAGDHPIGNESATIGPTS